MNKSCVGYIDCRIKIIKPILFLLFHPAFEIFIFNSQWIFIELPGQERPDPRHFSYTYSAPISPPFTTIVLVFKKVFI